MRQYICDLCQDALTTHSTDVRGVEESICDECLAPPHWPTLSYGWELSRQMRQAGLARARAFLRKQQYWWLEPAEEEQHEEHD